MQRFFLLLVGIFSLLWNNLEAGAGEPNFKIRLLSGSELKADKAWVQGDRLVYERYGYTGSVLMVDVEGLIDRELEELAAACVVRLKEARVNVGELDRAAGQLRAESGSQEERRAISRLAEALSQRELDDALGRCLPALQKLDRNKRMFEEARERAGGQKRP